MVIIPYMNIFDSSTGQPKRHNLATPHIYGRESSSLWSKWTWLQSTELSFATLIRQTSVSTTTPVGWSISSLSVCAIWRYPVIKYHDIFRSPTNFPSVLQRLKAVPDVFLWAILRQRPKVSEVIWSFIKHDPTFWFITCDLRWYLFN
jgi:hypothetical protein